MNVGDHYLALSDLKSPVNIKRTQSQENFLETRVFSYATVAVGTVDLLSVTLKGLREMKCYAQPSDTPNSLGPTMMWSTF